MPKYSPFRQKIADFFDRMSPAVLIPTIFLLALVLAGGLVWAGIKLSPIVVKEQNQEDRIQLKRNSVNSGNGGDFSNSNSNNDNFEDALFAQKEATVNSNNNRGNSYDGGENQSGSDQNLGSGNGGDQNSGAGGSGGTDSTTGSSQEGNSQNNSSQSVSSNSPENLGNGENNISASGSSEIYSGGTPRTNSNQNSSYLIGIGGCRYPSGDVSIWWHSATKQQQKCYIGKNGQPNLNRPPYFCPYENNEDCYYR